MTLPSVATANSIGLLFSGLVDTAFGDTSAPIQATSTSSTLGISTWSSLTLWSLLARSPLKIRLHITNA
ncbi:hypothetical protein HD598_001131 [Neomicrococcus aestuarii]|uniref:Uncharacterized protein n=1 Tax=Neomicrococcus aestuarii TaxID=556325 RepID=A0A7W8TTA3_9MICC|nr:hypothetical protein [Neomicrococcus aestuarii]